MLFISPVSVMTVTLSRETIFTMFIVEHGLLFEKLIVGNAIFT